VSGDLTPFGARSPGGHPSGALSPADLIRTDRSLGAVLGRRVDGSFEVDPWGFDADLMSVVSRMVPTLGVRVSGGGRVPDGPALCLWRGRRTGLVQLLGGLGAGTGRAVRFTGVPDVEPLVGVLRRFGGVGGDPADVRGLLRAGNLVAVRLDNAHEFGEAQLAGVGWVGEDTATAAGSPSGGAVAGVAGADRGDVGVDEWLPDDVVEAAIDVGVPVVPVVVHPPRLWSPLARVAVGVPVPTRTRFAPRTMAEVSSGVASSFGSLR
jgi:hypothetical protein